MAQVVMMMGESQPEDQAKKDESNANVQRLAEVKNQLLTQLVPLH